jgi:hypothetical protein
MTHAFNDLGMSRPQSSRFRILAPQVLYPQVTEEAATECNDPHSHLLNIPEGTVPVHGVVASFAFPDTPTQIASLKAWPQQWGHIFGVKGPFPGERETHRRNSSTRFDESRLLTRAEHIDDLRLRRCRVNNDDVTFHRPLFCRGESDVNIAASSSRHA